MDSDSGSIGEDVASHRVDERNDKKRKRGPTSNTIGGKRRGKKENIEVKYNTKGQPIGESRVVTSTEVGKLCRGSVPISYKTWHNVPDSIKDKILMVAESSYKNEQNDVWKKKLLIRVGSRFGDFKSRLYKKFILPNLGKPEALRDPPAKYTTIAPDHWREFVAFRTSKEFEEIRKKAQASRAENKYPHTMSRKGYSGLEEEIQEELGIDDAIGRDVLWKDGRKSCKNNGEYINEAVKEKAARIDELSKQVAEGTLKVEGINDVLTLALGTPEHSGRVRGVGHSVTPTAYFHTPRPSRSKKQAEMNGLIDYVLSLATELQRLGGQPPPFPPSFSPMAKRVGSNNSNVSRRSHIQPRSPSQADIRGMGNGEDLMDQGPPSPLRPQSQNDLAKEKGKFVLDSMPPSPHEEPSLKMKPCQLAVDSIDMVVAKGTLYEGGGPEHTLHGSLMHKGYARVSIDCLQKDEYACKTLPYPTEDVRTLGEALGGFVAWPRHLIIVHSAKVPSKPMGREDGNMFKVPSMPKKGEDVQKSQVLESREENNIVMAEFMKFVELSTQESATAAIKIEVNERVFVSSNPDREIINSTLIFKSDLMDLINCDALPISMIFLYMCALYEELAELGLRTRYRFTTPAGVSGFAATSSKLFDYLDSAQDDEIFFYPFNIGFHWVLCVVDPWKRAVFYLDPFGEKVHKTIRAVLSTALKQLDGSAKFRSTKAKATFHDVVCPRQQNDSVTCGFYVMRYMKDLVGSHEKHLTQVFCENDRYTDDQVVDVQVELVNYIRDRF